MDYEELYEDEYVEYDDEDYFNDYDWGYNEDEGFDPYAGCYTWDC